MGEHEETQGVIVPMASDGPVEQVLIPSTQSLGDGLNVRRALPSVRRRMVGPFIFFDHFGPATFRNGRGMDVRPHPHIGIATLTYLFEGEILHRDSLGSVQPIRPGEVNWMTAGGGIVHSERTPTERRIDGESLYGIQCWLALPRAREETSPTFVHHAESEMPVVEGEGLYARVLAGEIFGARSPLAAFTETIYAEVRAEVNTTFDLPVKPAERALYTVEGEILVGDRRCGAGELVVLRSGTDVTVQATKRSRLMLFGGEPMDGPRHLWWNLVSSRPELIAAAKSDWKAGRFPRVPGETEFIPLPDDPGPVRYP